MGRAGILFKDRNGVAHQPGGLVDLVAVIEQPAEIGTRAGRVEGGIAEMARADRDSFAVEGLGSVEITDAPEQTREIVHGRDSADAALSLDGLLRGERLAVEDLRLGEGPESLV